MTSIGNTTDDRDVLQCFLEMHSQYHNHKENMAYAIFGLEGAFFIGLSVFSQWPPELAKVSSNHLAGLFVAVWILFHLALRFQLRNRRIAAMFVASYYDALAQQSDLQFRRDDFIVYRDHRLDKFIDTCLLPVRSVIRAADVDPAKLQDGEVVHPRTLKAFYYHLARHKSVASTSWVKYAYPIEWLASFGSIFLLFVALYRVVGTTARVACG